MNLFRRGWAGAWAAVYFLTNTAAVYAVEKSLWEERRAALRRTASGARAAPVVFVPGASRLTVFDGGSTPSQPPSNFFKTAVAFDAASAALPFGSVSNMREGRRGAPVVFLVQDVHGNDGAQKNIGGLLTEWAARGVTAVGVEGAWVPIDSSAYHNPPSPSSVAHVAGALRSAGWLTGAEWAGLTSPHPISLTGIESPELYHANLKAARECVARRPAVAEFLTQITDFLQTQKKLFYSSDLTRFDRSATDYHDGRLGLGAHVRFLAGLPGAQSKAGVQVKDFLNALDWEARLSFVKADSERQGLMDRLSRCLDSRALDTLLNQAVAYRAGKMTNGDFYSHLKNLCAAHRISLKDYPAFSDYLRYVGVVQSIQRGDLLRELDRWETDLAQGLAKTPEERRLLALDADAVLLKKLLENEMSPESWATFLQRRDEVLALPARLGEWGDFKGPSEGLAGLSHPHQEFCRLAIERNKTLASNFLANVKARKADRAVLVSGGFHTPGLQDELARQGCSTVVITPRIDKVEGKPLDVFARDPLPFDHLFAGKPISLSPELLMGTPGGIAVLNMAITMDASGSAGAQKGLRTVRFNVAGKELFAAMGPKKSLDEISKNHPRLGPVLIKDQTHFVVYSHKKPKWTFGDGALKTHFGWDLNRTVFGGILTWLFSTWKASRMWIVPPSPHENPLPKPLVEINRQGLAVKIVVKDPSTQKEMASAMVGGKRGAIEIQSVSIEPGESNHAYDLIAGAVREFLLMKGQGRVLLRGVIDPRIKQAAKEMFGDNLIMAKKGFSRSLTSGPWKDLIDPSSDEFSQFLDDPNAAVDLAGTLTPEARQALWPNEDLPPRVEGATEPVAPRVIFIPSTDEALRRAYSDFSALESDLYEILIDDQKVGDIIFSETSKKLFIKTIKIDDSVQGNGIGKIVFRALAKRATLILNPGLNSAGHPVPFERRSAKNPAAFSIWKGIYGTGTMEAVPLGNKYQTEEDEPNFSWDNALKEGAQAFDQLTGSANVGEDGEYIQLFHLRGEIAQDIEDEAARETLREQRVADKELFSRGATPLNSFALLGSGFPFDPLIGLTVATVFIMAMLFKDEILNWLKGRFPPGVQDFVNSAVPDLTEFRPIIARFIARNIGIFILKTVEILGRLFGMDQLQAPVSLGIFPLHGQVTDSSSREPSSSLDNIVNAMDSSDIESLYNNLAHYFQLRGRAADVGSSSYDVPAKGLLAGGIEKVSLVDHLHHETKTIFPGIEVVPGDATNLSNHLGEESLDAVVFHRSLHHIVVDKESRGSAAGRELIEAGVFSDDIGFHVDLLSRVMGETFKTLKPGGRVLLYFDAHTFRIPGSPGFFWWSLEDMLADKGFGDVSLITSKNGTVVATGVRPNRNHWDTFVGGIEVLRRSVIDTLSDSDRDVFSKALGAISPTVFDMQGVEVLIDPRRVGSEKNLVEELNEKMGVNGGSVGEMSPDILEGIIQQDPASIHWVRGFSSRPNGVNSLAETCVEAARTGDANASGAALAAWDDSKFLAGPNPDVVANLLAVLIGDKADRADELIDSFADAYNRARAGLLLPKLLAGTLTKSPGGSEAQPGIILNISALFDPQAGETAKNNTWLALAAALSARERNSKVPLGLVVHGVEVNEEKVTTTLSQSVPRWANFMTDGVTLFVQGSTTNKAVFVGGKFSLTELRRYPLWARPLNVLGLTAESIVESVDHLESVQLIPLDEFVDKQLEQVLHRLRFVLRNA
jgi:SAM-dependent methyltransferase